MHLRLSFKDFEDLNVPNLIIDIWFYNDPDCRMFFYCGIYSLWCEIILEKKWRDEWGDFHFIMQKIKENDTTFINIGDYCCADRFLILAKLIEIKKKVQCFWSFK